MGIKNCGVQGGEGEKFGCERIVRKVMVGDDKGLNYGSSCEYQEENRGVGGRINSIQGLRVRVEDDRSGIFFICRT